MPATFAISTAAVDVLRRSLIDETSLQLPQQLDRALYVEVNDVITGIGGEWKRGLKRHVFDFDPRPLIETVVATGVGVNRKLAFQSFYTPPTLANDLVMYADLKTDEMTVLEPSCGDARLADTATRKGHRKNAITCYDIDPFAIRIATAKGYRAREVDFLAVAPEPTFDRVVMNPPFTKDQDVKHVLHAYRFLKPGGRLVSITSNHWTFAKTKANEQFRHFLREVGADDIDLGPRAFEESGTSVATRIVVIDKPRF